jgi:hypothetical protein
MIIDKIITWSGQRTCAVVSTNSLIDTNIMPTTATSAAGPSNHQEPNHAEGAPIIPDATISTPARVITHGSELQLVIKPRPVTEIAV